MLILVTNRAKIESGAILPLLVSVSHIVISYCNVGSALPIIKRNTGTLFVLSLLFDDTDDVNDPGAFTRKAAALILKYIELHVPRCVVCQCEAGISRSAGTAAALAKIYNGDDTPFFRLPYIPNRLIYRTILSVYAEMNRRN